MKPDSPFLDGDAAPLVTVQLDGKLLKLPRAENLAAALLSAGVTVFRTTPKSGAPRGPFCMMGACFDCLVEIDGVTTQACMTEVKDGMQIVRPNAGGLDNAK